MDLTTLLEKKIEILTQYLEITITLNFKIDSGEMEEIALLLDQRQGLIEEIMEIDQRLEKIRSQLKGYSESQNGSGGEIFRLNQRFLKDIENLDQLCIIKLAQERDRIRNQLSELHNKSKTAGFYLKYLIDIPRFLDIRR